MRATRSSTADEQARAKQARYLEAQRAHEDAVAQSWRIHRSDSATGAEVNHE